VSAVGADYAFRNRPRIGTEIVETDAATAVVVGIDESRCQHVGGEVGIRGARRCSLATGLGRGESTRSGSTTLPAAMSKDASVPLMRLLLT
jgi:hypothetical protein